MAAARPLLLRHQPLCLTLARPALELQPLWVRACLVWRGFWGAQQLWQSVLGVKVEALLGRVLLPLPITHPRPWQVPTEVKPRWVFSLWGGEGKIEARVLVPGLPRVIPVPGALGSPPRAKCRR